MRGYNTKKVISIDDDRDAPDEDVTELMAVSGSANQKSDSGLDEWLPTYQPCVYVQRYLTVAVKYQLPITLPSATPPQRPVPPHHRRQHERLPPVLRSPGDRRGRGLHDSGDRPT